MSSDDLPDDFMTDAHSTTGYMHGGTAPNNSGDVSAHDLDDDEEEEELGIQGNRDDDDDEEEEEEDEEEEEEAVGRNRKRQKRSNAVNRFLDVEAEVDNDDDEFDDDEDDFTGARDFITDDTVDTDENRSRIIHGHQRIDREKDAILEQDAEQVARRIKERYAARSGTARYMGDSDQVPQRLLMPSVKDAFLWQVRVKTGREKEIVFSIMRKFLENEYTPSPLGIYSAFYRDSLPGMIYIEARNERQVSQAISGLVGVYPSKGFILVPIDEMASLLKIKKIETNITPGTWVRIKRGKYAGDLAQVLDVTDNGEEAGLKFIPRIDLTPKENGGPQKRKKGLPTSAIARPPQRLFNYEEVVKVWGVTSCNRKGLDEFVFQGDTYKRGFVEKDVKITGLIVDNVSPTLDEITMFQGGEDVQDGTSALDLSVIANAAKKAATAVLQPGDHVEVFEGEQIGLDGTVESIRDDVVILRPKVLDMEDSRIEVAASSVRKRFKSGDHVKVMAGKNADETGLVVAVNGDVVTIWSDVSNQEVTVFSKDVREAAEVGSGTNAVGQYELHDLVQLDQQTIGVIFKTERVSLRVLDQNGIVRQVQPHQITMRRDSNRAVATDADGQPIRVQDTLKEVAGERRRGTVLHIYQSQVAFLHNREIAENNGVFVVRCRSLTSLTPKNSNFGPKPTVDLVAAAAAASAFGGRGPKDRLINAQVYVVKGEFKGYMGTVKDTNGSTARVELVTNRKVISIDKSKLRRKNPNTGVMEEVETAFSNMPPPSGYTRPNNWGSSPSPAPSGRTPNPYMTASGGRTPGQAIAGRTPNPYNSMGGARTPAWGAQPTPNPYTNSGGRTGQWNQGVTPNPYVGGPSGSFDGRTPARTETPAWTLPSPVHGSSSPAWTPAASAATPGAFGTPGIPTPMTSAATPGGWGQTPAPISAATPGGAYTAATPGAALSAYEWGGTNEDSMNEQWLEACVGYTVHATFESKGRYLTGELDSLTCMVSNIQVSHQPGIASTATAAFEGGQTATTTVDRFLPILPERGDYALAFAGPDKGLVIKVERHDSDSRDFSGVDVKADKLAVIREAEVVKVEYSP